MLRFFALCCGGTAADSDQKREAEATAARQRAEAERDPLALSSAEEESGDEGANVVTNSRCGSNSPIDGLGGEVRTSPKASSRGSRGCGRSSTISFSAEVHSKEYHVLEDTDEEDSTGTREETNDDEQLEEDEDNSSNSRPAASVVEDGNAKEEDEGVESPTDVMKTRRVLPLKTPAGGKKRMLVPESDSDDEASTDEDSALPVYARGANFAIHDASGPKKRNSGAAQKVIKDPSPDSDSTVAPSTSEETSLPGVTVQMTTVTTTVQTTVSTSSVSVSANGSTGYGKMPNTTTEVRSSAACANFVEEASLSNPCSPFAQVPSATSSSYSRKPLNEEDRGPGLTSQSIYEDEEEVSSYDNTTSLDHMDGSTEESSASASFDKGKACGSRKRSSMSSSRKSRSVIGLTAEEILAKAASAEPQKGILKRFSKYNDTNFTPNELAAYYGITPNLDYV
ncbi:unnamed protein product [Amoebophrya sp. A25]|nr:unnamed protein product [Amoebophrya sp. A25]|eukprot:GSA25T00015352001.1